MGKKTCEDPVCEKICGMKQKIAWKSASPELKRRMKSDLTKLVGEMTV